MTWTELALLSIRDPREAAELILGLHMNRVLVWQGVVATAAVNTVLFALSLQIAPAPESWPQVLQQPFVYFTFVAGGLVLLAHALTWTGRALGGEGSLDDMLVLMVWMQALRCVMQAGTLALMLLSPGIAALASLVLAAISFWIFLTFIAAALRLDGLGKAFVTLFVAGCGLVLGLALLLSLIGIGSLGEMSNV